MKVLILDANQRSALAATRSLGSKGVPVVVADETEKTLAGSSKYCKENFIYPSPYEYFQDFITTLKEECIERNINVIFPMTEITTHLMLKHRDQFKGVIIPFAYFETFDLLTDKCKLFELAKQLGVPFPATYFIKNSSSTLALTSSLSSSLSSASSSASPSSSTSTLTSIPLRFPVVIKPYRSRILSNGKWIAASVNYANSVEELEDIINKTEYLNRFPFLVQEYIRGEGRGIFTIYNKGRAIAFFAHRRLREKPPSGGVSVLCESIEVDPVLKKLSQNILDYVQWHSVAMVEFKVSSDGTPYLMEVNARFWGSLQLAIDAGVDFPWLLYQMAIGETLDSVNSYKIGIKNRWLLGDLDHLYLTFKNHSMQNSSSKIKAVIQFLNFFKKNTHYEVNRWNDLNPFFSELKRYFGK